MQSYPNVFSMSSLFSKAILIRRMSLFPPALVYRSQTARKTFPKGFLVMSFPFTQYSSSKTSFFAGLSPSKFAYPLHKYPDKSFTLSVLATFGMKYPIGTIRIFFYPDMYPGFFYPVSYGIDIRFASALCKREAYLDKNLSDFVSVRFRSA